MKEQITQLFREFESLKALVLGDVMLDAYFFGQVDRISPEAPVPVVSVQTRERRAGGAANVAMNLCNLGAEVYVCSVVGNDTEGEFLDQLFAEEGIRASLLRETGRRTTVKTRIIGNKQQVLRVDEEDIFPIHAQTENEVLRTLNDCISAGVDVLIIQDYNKGLLTPKIIRETLKLAERAGIPVVVDPKQEHFLSYRGVALFKPNRKELIEGLKLETSLQTTDEIEQAMRLLQEKTSAAHIMLTLSEDGAAMLSGNRFMTFPAHSRKIVDVSGAGDTVISVAALCVALKTEASLIAELANLAGGQVCEKLGVVPLDRDLLLTEALELMC